jgi:hypothetical protein
MRFEEMLFRSNLDACVCPSPRYPKTNDCDQEGGNRKDISNREVRVAGLFACLEELSRTRCNLALQCWASIPSVGAPLGS